MAGFPRMLFLGGVAGAPRLVHSDEEDAQARAQGWRTYGETDAPEDGAPAEPQSARRGRSRKATP